MQAEPSPVASDVVKTASPFKQAGQMADAILQISTAISQATNEQEILTALGILTEPYDVAVSSLSYIEVDENNYPYAIKVVATTMRGGQAIPADKLPDRLILRSETPFVDLTLSQPNYPVF